MKNKFSILKKVIFLLFVTGTISIIWIINRNFPWTKEFVIGYLALLFVISIYLIYATISNIRKLRWVQIKKRIIRFFGLFISFWIIDIVLDYLFKTQTDIFSKIAIPLGMALGIVFIPKDDK